MAYTRVALLSLMCLQTVSYVHADTVHLNFSGPITNSFGNAPQQTGDRLFGSLAVDTNTLSVTEEKPGEYRRYEGPANLQLSFTRGSSNEPFFTLDLRDGPLNAVINNMDSYDGLAWGIRSEQFGFSAFLGDQTGTVFSNTDFPRNLDLRAFNGPFLSGRYFSGVFLDASGNAIVGQFDGQITTLNGIHAPETPNPVPEPTSAILAGSGILFGVYRRAAMRKLRGLNVRT